MDGPKLVHQLSMRCSQFLTQMSQLDEKWEPAKWFEDLVKSDKLQETVSFEELRDFLTGFIKEIKNKRDVEEKVLKTTEEWIVSEICYIHSLIKGEQKNPSLNARPVPERIKTVYKDVKPMIDSIHVKLDAAFKLTKQKDKKDPPGSPLSQHASKEQTRLPNTKALEKKNAELNKDYEQRGRLLGEREKELGELRDANAKLEKENSKLNESVDQLEPLEKSLMEATSSLRRVQYEKDTLDKKCGEAQQNIVQLNQTLKELQQRYSALAGAKMSHDNPDIADLSDPCRPTKLAEMFSELYDNQWTDGFAALAKYEDEKAIEKLLNILKDTNAFCKQEVQDLRRTLSINILDVCTLQNMESGRSKSKQAKGGQADLVKDKRIDDLIRDNAMLPVPALQQKYLKQSEKTLKGLKTEKGTGTKAITDYVEKCVELCWLMAIQTPPVVIDDDVKAYEKQPFDERRFKPYTKKGQIIDYVVWPPLYIPGGGMLGKGVAQCK